MSLDLFEAHFNICFIEFEINTSVILTKIYLRVKNSLFILHTQLFFSKSVSFIENTWKAIEMIMTKYTQKKKKKSIV